VVVGGQAVVSSRVFSATEDLDVMVAVRDFDEAVRRLSADPRLGTPDRVSWVAKFEIHLGPRAGDYVELDVLNGKKYCGDRTPDEFFDYMVTEWTIETDLGPSAEIPMVWYTRLMVGDSGDKYVRKVVRDIRAGASADRLDDVPVITDRFGARSKVEPRVARVREILAEE
jgi:hypothetical protein